LASLLGDVHARDRRVAYALDAPDGQPGRDQFINRFDGHPAH
jgi:hypothetical protein